MEKAEQFVDKKAKHEAEEVCRVSFGQVRHMHALCLIQLLETQLRRACRRVTAGLEVTTKFFVVFALRSIYICFCTTCINTRLIKEPWNLCMGIFKEPFFVTMGQFASYRSVK